MSQLIHMPAPDLRTAVENNHEAVEKFIRAARAVPATRWQEPRAEGKWSPAQVTEHLAVAYELSRKMVAGNANVTEGLPPRILQPLIRTVVRLTVLRTGKFMRAKAPAFFQPSSSPASQEVLCKRLEAASNGFEQDAMRAKQTGQTAFDHAFFGRFGVAEYLQLQAYHTVHHRAQLS